MDTYQPELDDGRARTIHGDGGPDPQLTITMDATEFIRLVSGNLEPTQAYFDGRVQLAGDVMVAARLASLFRMPGPNPGAGGAESPDSDR